jgi:recombinational DNA repair protein RecR
VVEEPQNIITIEKTREFKGLHHMVRGGLLPLWFMHRALEGRREL